ncbi:MAG: phosphoribosylglycinamide formyltransferase [Clostridiales bacterium]
MLKHKIAVLVSGSGTNLQAILDKAAAGELPHVHIALVIADNPAAYALTRAHQANIPTAIVCRKQFSQQEQFEQQLLTVLAQNNIELIVLAGFLAILSGNFVQHYPKRILNIHPSLIPSFCGKGYYGLKVHQAALAYGVKLTGATVHFVNEIPDGGEIISQKAVEILPGDTPEQLQKRVMEQAEWQLLPAAIESVCTNLP